MTLMKLNLGENKGFTLTEIMTTLAIVGVVSAVGIPGFARFRMEANQETVRQRLRELHRDMNDILNGGGQLPWDMGNLGNTEEELAITASLNAIDAKGYMTTDYFPDRSLMNYTYRTRPKPGQMNIAGAKCFLVDLFGVTDVSCSDGAGVAMIPLAPEFHDSQRNKIINFILSDPALTEAQRLELVEGFIASLARDTLGQRNYYNAEVGGGLVGFPRSDGSYMLGKRAELYAPDGTQYDSWTSPYGFEYDGWTFAPDRPVSSKYTNLTLDANNAGKEDTLNTMIGNAIQNLQGQGFEIYDAAVGENAQVPTGYYAPESPLTVSEYSMNYSLSGCSSGGGCREIGIRPRSDSGETLSHQTYGQSWASRDLYYQEQAALTSTSSFQAYKSYATENWIDIIGYWSRPPRNLR